MLFGFPPVLVSLLILFSEPARLIFLFEFRPESLRERDLLRPLRCMRLSLRLLIWTDPVAPLVLRFLDSDPRRSESCLFRESELRRIFPLSRREDLDVPSGLNQMF